MPPSTSCGWRRCRSVRKSPTANWSSTATSSPEKRQTGARSSADRMSGMTLTPEQLRAAPKVLLHDHLDGGLRPATIVDLAQEIGHELPRKEPDELGRWFVESADSGSLERYLKTFAHT